MRCLLCFVLVCLLPFGSVAQEFEHEHIQTLQQEELSNAVALMVTADDKFLYEAGFSPGYINCYQRDQETGELTRVHSYAENGVVSFDLSSDEKWMAVASIMDHKVLLFKRDAETGGLEKVSEVGQEQVTDLQGPVSAIISPDSKFVYVSDSSASLMMVFKISDEGQLEFMQKHEGEDECLAGCRIMSTDPAGKFFYVPCYTAATLSIFNRDETTGELEFVDYVEDDSIYASLLAGAHGTAISPDGKHLYVVSGRFSGDNAITVFSIKEDGTVKMIQEFENEVEVEGFTGGNLIAVSHDGESVYASGATSSNLAVFNRNPESGKLKFDGFLEIDGESDLGMTAGIAVSHDHRFVYIAGESLGKIYAFARKKAEE